MGGVLCKISVREAILARFTDAALKGDAKSASFLFQRYDMLEEGHEPAQGHSGRTGYLSARERHSQEMKQIREYRYETIEEIDRDLQSRGLPPMKDLFKIEYHPDVEEAEVTETGAAGGEAAPGAGSSITGKAAK
jgi:hypothetical protein